MKHFKYKVPKVSIPTMLLLFSVISSESCRKIVEVEAPVTSTNATNVYANDGTATAVLTGIYTNVSARGESGFISMSFYPTLSSDELRLADGVVDLNYIGYHQNELSSLNSITRFSFWEVIYPVVFVTNSAIEGLQQATSLTPVVREHLLGEAKFMRAFCYFYLTNLYGDVPLVTSTDWKVNAELTRAPQEQVYQQIIADLIDAQELLSEHYLQSDAVTSYSAESAERVRPNKWAATALLARTYLYTGDWMNAEAQASAVIDHVSLYSLNMLNDVFLKNSQEAIWQLQPVGAGANANTPEGSFFILPPEGPNELDHPVYLSEHIVNNFESGDQRKSNWVNSVTPPNDTRTYYYAYKYKIGAVDSDTKEYSMVLRLAEQYLIRAEARARQGNISGAQNDLNRIRVRAGLANTTASDQASLLAAIQQERKVELFTEWGLRWLDLKRTNTVDAVMNSITSQKGGNWQTSDQLYPIPASELQQAQQIVQNPGY